MMEALQSVGIEVIVALAVGVIGGWIGGLITSIRKLSKVEKNYESLESSVKFLAMVVDKGIKKNHPNDDIDIADIVSEFLGKAKE